MSLKFYEDNAEQFAANTLDVDMSAIYERFLSALPQPGPILDAGCGAGRDVAAFLQLGYEVSGFDASAKLVEIARKVSNIEIQHSTFLAYENEQLFAGIGNGQIVVGKADIDAIQDADNASIRGWRRYLRMFRLGKNTAEAAPATSTTDTSIRSITTTATSY